MNIPGFTAQKSVYKKSEQYNERTDKSFNMNQHSQVIPSQLPPGCTMVEECWPFWFGPFCDSYMLCRTDR